MELLFVPAGLLVLYLFYFAVRWRKFKPQLFQDQLETDAALAPGVLHRHLGSAAWPQGFSDALKRFANSLRSTEGGAQRACAAVLTELPAGHRQWLIDKARESARSALHRGEVESFLCKSGSHRIYTVVFPTLCLQPHLLRRYDGFQHGIVEHIDRVYNLVAAESPDAALLTLICLLRTDAREAVLLLGYARGKERLYPDGLLDENEIRRAATASLATRERHDFTLHAA